jgi:hypothetical protein
MAEIFVDEGLDAILAIFPKNGAGLASVYIGLFTSQTAATVAARTATGGAAPAGWVEAAGVSYARQQILAASWGAEATVGGGREVTAGQVTFPAVGAGGWGTINGFFLATLSASGVGDKIIYFANFDDVTAIFSSVGSTIKVTPRIRYDG